MPKAAAKGRRAFSIMRWILGFGRHALVLEPPELKAAVEAEAEGILARSRGAREEGKNVYAGKKPKETSAAAKRVRV
ncbi:MAG: WYL domain-containing protein [Firmicutes bacterium]|nr:WYL domain-containing protein [Bacillota bacterium]